MRLRIRDMREDSNKTQVEISKYLTCDQSLYSKYERGERDIPVSILIKLAIYYHTSVDYLVGLTDEKGFEKTYKRIKSLRDSENLTQAEVAKKLNISLLDYSRYESGERNIPTRILIKLADLYGKSVDYILERINHDV